MRQAVLDGFLGFTQTFESYLTFLYLDVDGLVTIGYGNLVDPVESVQGLEFAHPDGTIATQAEVNQAWQIVKSQQASRAQGGDHYAKFTSIRATPAAIQKLCEQKLAQIDQDVRKFFPAWDSFPAKAQLGITSMCWAMGSGRLLDFVHFRAMANLENWAAVAVPHSDPNSCMMNEQGENQSFHLRNLANVELFRRASLPNDNEDSLT